MKRSCAAHLCTNEPGGAACAWPGKVCFRSCCRQNLDTHSDTLVFTPEMETAGVRRTAKLHVDSLVRPVDPSFKIRLRHYLRWLRNPHFQQRCVVLAVELVSRAPSSRLVVFSISLGIYKREDSERYFILKTDQFS